MHRWRACPAQAGLYASIASLLAYTLFGTSRHQKVLASSTMAVMSAAVVAPLAEGDLLPYLCWFVGCAGADSRVRY
jgi:SulP family sulfate permease